MLGARILPGWPTDPESRTGLEVQLVALRRRPSEEPWRVRLIVLRGERRTVGTIHLKGPPRATGTVDLGWEVEAADRRQGLATEAARAVLGWALGQPRVRRVTARIREENAPSIGVARRLGMRRTIERYPKQGMIWEVVRT
jgi:RimJ/RimL family protein N-acetyltransferase